MKTSKLVVIASILVVAIVGVSLAPDVNAVNTKKMVVISLEEAVQDIDLVRAMHVQLNDDFLQSNQAYYTQNVLFKNTTVYITGTYYGWRAFFRTRAYIQANDIDL